MGIANGDTMSFFGGLMDKVQDAVEDLTDGDGLSADTKEDLHQFFEDVGADKIIDGIKEALKVAIQKAVAITGQMNGFLANELIKIQLPGKLQVVAEALKAAGMDEHAATKHYAVLEEKARPLPFIGDLLGDFDLETYTVEMALKGLFTVMGGGGED